MFRHKRLQNCPTLKVVVLEALQASEQVHGEVLVGVLGDKIPEKL